MSDAFFNGEKMTLRASDAGASASRGEERAILASTKRRKVA